MSSPYTHHIGKNSVDSHQTSPECVLTVLRWSNRDTYNYQSPANKSGNFSPTTVRSPLVICSDCISLTVTNSKSNLNSQLTAILLCGDINYAAAVAPGDFVIANMLNWGKYAEKVATKALNRQPINHYNDGFKGVYRIESCRERLMTSPDGKKQRVFHLHALGFKEFRTKIYFNQAIQAEFAKGNDLAMFLVGDWYQQRLKKTLDVQDILQDLLTLLIGQDKSKKNPKIQDYGKTSYKLPNGIGDFLGRDMTYACDMYNYLLGIWGTSGSAKNATPAQGFNSTFEQQGTARGMYLTGQKIQGNKLVSYDNWNQVEAWSILQSYLNDTINEMYSTYRIDPAGYVMPTIVIRQKPFTSLHWKDSYTGGAVQTPSTKFLELPRWSISPDLIYDHDLGRDEAARINFVQVFGVSIAETAANNQAAQIAQKNFVYDKDDMLRSGMRPYVATAPFDFFSSNSSEIKVTKAPVWAQLVADWLLDGHLRYNGTINCAGIVEPISVGDNLLYNSIVYHIEQITHSIAISGDGKKHFTTSLQLSFGTSILSDSTRPVYPQMEYTNRDTENQADYNSEQILTGISDTQDTVARKNSDGEKINATSEASFTLNPKKQAKMNKSAQDSKSQKYTEPDPSNTSSGSNSSGQSILNKILNKGS